MIAGMPLDTHGCGRPQVYTGCWPETSGFFFFFFCQVTLPSGWLTRRLPPEQANERKKVRGQPERRATVSLLPTITSDIHPICQIPFTRIVALTPAHPQGQGTQAGDARSWGAIVEAAY